MTNSTLVYDFCQFYGNTANVGEALIFSQHGSNVTLNNSSFASTMPPLRLYNNCICHFKCFLTLIVPTRLLVCKLIVIIFPNASGYMYLSKNLGI